LKKDKASIAYVAVADASDSLNVVLHLPSSLQEAMAAAAREAAMEDAAMEAEFSTPQQQQMPVSMDAENIRSALNKNETKLMKIAKFSHWSCVSDWSF
jgi:hypothetical protein